jgi:hypothetical protein
MKTIYGTPTVLRCQLGTIIARLAQELVLIIVLTSVSWQTGASAEINKVGQTVPESCFPKVEVRPGQCW